MKFYGKVKDCNLQVFNRASMVEYIVSLNGEDVEITIEKRNKRSTRQNRTWRMYMRIISAEHPIKWSADKWHEVLKFKFLLREEFDEDTGEVFKYVGSTADLTKSEFVDLIHRLQEYMANEFGLVLPDPEQQTTMDV